MLSYLLEQFFTWKTKYLYSIKKKVTSWKPENFTPNYQYQGRIQDFKLGGGGALKIIAPSGKFWGYFVWKITIWCKKKHIFSNFRGGGAPDAPAPPPGSAPVDLPSFSILALTFRPSRLRAPKTFKIILLFNRFAYERTWWMLGTGI